MNRGTEKDQILIDVHLDRQDPQTLYSELRAALTSEPRMLPTKYLYDDKGSALFEQICELPEYYQTRTESQLLSCYADQIVSISGAEELVELGSGAATKTRILLNAMARAEQLRFYVPFDVSEGIVRRVAQELVNEYEGLQVHGVVGDFLTHLEHIPEGGRRLVMMLGGTIGNLTPHAAQSFLSSIQKEMATGDYFLLGIQLETDISRLEAAYNDAQGVTAQFNKNILSVIQKNFGASLNPDNFSHVALYNKDTHSIEMRLRSMNDQRITVPAIQLDFTLKKEEDLLTEISTKFTQTRAENLLSSSGFQVEKWFTDPGQLMGLPLARKP